MTVFALVEPRKFGLNLAVCAGVDTMNAATAHLISRYTSYGGRFNKRLLDEEEREVLRLIVREKGWYVFPLFGVLPGCLSQWVLGDCDAIGGLTGSRAAAACLLSYCVFTISMSAASLGTGSVVMSSKLSPLTKAIVALGLALFAVFVIFKSFDVWRSTTDEVRQRRRQRGQEAGERQGEDERLLADGGVGGVELGSVGI